MIKNILGVILIFSNCVFTQVNANVDTLFHLVYGSYNDDALALERANELLAKGYKPHIVPAGEFNRVVFLTVGSKAEAIMAIEKMPGSWFYREEVSKGAASKQTGFSLADKLSEEDSDLEKGSPENQIQNQAEEKKIKFIFERLKDIKTLVAKFFSSVIGLSVLFLFFVILLFLLFRRGIKKFFSEKKTKKINSPYKCNEIVIVGRTQVNLMQTLFRRNYGLQISFNIEESSFSEQFTLAQISSQGNRKKNALKSHLPLNKKTKIADFYKRFSELFGFEVKIIHIDTGELVDPQDNFKEASDKGYVKKIAKDLV